MLRRTGFTPLLIALFAALCVAAPGAAHPGHEGSLPHPVHHVDPFFGMLAAGLIAAGITWSLARRRSRALPALQATAAALAAAGAWLLVA
jgi:hypothetical protein